LPQAPRILYFEHMARASIALSVLISSPSDVEAECATVRSAIYDWNSSFSRNLGITLEPVQWKTHAYPESGDRPQAIINKQIVDESDMVIAVFGHRIGTSTGAAQSGTIEEIERLRQKGKRVAVYFSNAPIPRDHDSEQLRLLNKYRESLKLNTLFWSFDSTQDLYRLVSQHLAKSVSQLYQDLRESGTIQVLASQFPGAVGGPELTTPPSAENKASAAVRAFKLQHAFEGEFPDGPQLWLTSTREIKLRQMDYLDENGARVSSEPLSAEGQDLRIPIDHTKLVKIHNLKPRAGGAIAMQFRLHFEVENRDEAFTIPAIIEPGYKHIGNSQTYFMKLIG
jgi:hypothetical protein